MNIEGETMSIKVGDQAPKFTLLNQNKEKVSLESI